mgnify:CR=1 FL=1
MLHAALIGFPSTGKSTLLRCFNRMNDTIPGCRVTGQIAIDGEAVLGDAIDVVQLRARVGMVFQKPNPFPKSIYDNVAYGPRIHGLAKHANELDAIFTPFRRGTSCGRSRGLGLGLAIARQVATVLGGRVEVAGAQSNVADVAEEDHPALSTDWAG